MLSTLKYYYKNFKKNPSLSIKYLLAKKIFHEPTEYKGVRIYSLGGYSFFLELKNKIERIEKLNDNEYIVTVKDLGRFYIKDYIWPVLDQVYNDYKDFDVKDKVVLDIGAYVGDSAIYFIRKGAKKVYAYEAVESFYKIMLRNIELNNLQDKIIPINVGIDCGYGESSVNLNYASSGLTPGDYTIKLTSIQDIFEEIYNKEGEFVTKIDCEGCEYSLLCLPDEILKYSREYIIEIHGSPQTIISKFLRNGYKMKVIKKENWYLGIYYFYL